MTFWGFVERHPVISFLSLVVTVASVVDIVRVVAGAFR